MWVVSYRLVWNANMCVCVYVHMCVFITAIIVEWKYFFVWWARRRWFVANESESKNNCTMYVCIICTATFVFVCSLHSHFYFVGHIAAISSLFQTEDFLPCLALESKFFQNNWLLFSSFAFFCIVKSYCENEWFGLAVEIFRGIATFFWFLFEKFALEKCALALELLPLQF